MATQLSLSGQQRWFALSGTAPAGVWALLLEDLSSGCPLDSALAELERRSQGGGSVVAKLPAWLGACVSSGFFSAVEY